MTPFLRARCLGAGEASLLQDVPPVIAALVAEQELVDNGDHSASESPLGADDAHDDDSEPDDADEPYDFDFAVGRRGSTRHTGRKAGSKNIKWAVECEMANGQCSLAELKLGMLGHANLNWRREHGDECDFAVPCVFKCASHRQRW